MLILSVSISFVAHSIGQQATRKCFTVVDETREPLIGASAYVKRTGQGASADLDGIICITAEPYDELIITFIGYQSITVPFSSITDGELVIFMTPDSL